MYYLLTIGCVIGIAIGQVLFKLSAIGFNTAGTWFNLNALITLSGALFLYAITTVGWVLVLRHLPLVKAYPFMALAFIVVPLLSHFFIGETLDIGYFIGAILISVGIVITYI